MAGAELVTSKDSGIRSVRDLDGKTVAIPSIGNTQHLPLLTRASLIARLVKNPPAMQETPVRFLGWEDLLEKG